MIKLIILEGARGGGKSSIAQQLRQQLPSSTLINMTGFKEDGFSGLDKIFEYYRAFMQYLQALSNSAYEYTIILDRTFISEMVYSGLYKSYAFEKEFKILLHRLLALDAEITLFHLYYEQKDIPERLNRNKTDHFASFEEAEQIRDQIEAYGNVFTMIDEYRKDHGFAHKINMFVLNTSAYSIEDVTERIKSLCQ